MKPIFMLGATLLTAATAPQIAEAANKLPNIIFIYADDMGYGDVAALNSKSLIETPYLDKIASEAVTFSNAHTGSSVSTPSRYGAVTGRYAWRSSLKKGVLHGYSPSLIERDRATIASMLHEEGYTTMCVGKWHLGMDGWKTTDGKSYNRNGENIDHAASVLDGVTNRGFDYYYGISASLDMAPYLIIENDRVIETPDVYYSKEKKNRSPFGRDGYGIAGRQPSFFLSHFTDKVISKIGEHSKDKNPFFIYFPLNAPHAPIAPHADFAGRSKAGDHGDYVMEVDYRISQIYAALEANGIADNTVVFISSDNGPEVAAYERYLTTGHRSSGDWKGVKRDIWEGGHRVPTFMTWPAKIKKPVNIDETISTLDFYATAADIVGHELNEKEAPDSYSVMPLISGKGRYERPYTLHHSVSGRFAIRKGDWVLIETMTGHDNGIKPSMAEYYVKSGYGDVMPESDGELFNLKKDPRQEKNLYAERPEIVKELLELLNECRNADK